MALSAFRRSRWLQGQDGGEGGGAGLRLSFYFVSFVCVVDIFDELHKFVYILVLKFELLSSRAL